MRRRTKDGAGPASKSCDLYTSLPSQENSHKKTAGGNGLTKPKNRAPNIQKRAPRGRPAAKLGSSYCSRSQQGYGDKQRCAQDALLEGRAARTVRNDSTTGNRQTAKRHLNSCNEGPYLGKFLSHEAD